MHLFSRSILQFSAKRRQVICSFHRLMCSTTSEAKTFHEFQTRLKDNTTAFKIEFVKKLGEKSKRRIPDDSIQRLNFLESIGLKWYEIGEGFSLLSTNENLIKRKLTYLKAHGHDRVSVRLLHLFNPRRTNESLQAMNIWLEKVTPHSSVAEYIAHQLCISEEEIVYLYYQIPTLCQWTSVASGGLFTKINILRQNGFELEDICNNEHLLHKCSLEYIDKHVGSKQCTSVPDIFKAVTHERLLLKLASKLGMEVGDMETSELVNIHGNSNQKLQGLIQRVAVLISAGFESKDIIEYIEGCSIGRLKRETSAKYKESLEELKSEGLTPSSGLKLKSLGLHSRKKQLLQEYRSKRPSKYDLAKILNCPAKEIQRNLPRDAEFPDFQRSDIKRNWKFLRSVCEFDDDSIKRLPLILCFNHNVLCGCWDQVVSHPHYSIWKENQWTLINVLCYFAELKPDFINSEPT